jgi:methylmalonyl-CoA mutase N-terminal domain/subunit
MEGLDARGGVLAAIEHGTVQREIQESAYRTQRAIDAGEQVVVGVNRFADEAAPGVDVFRVDAGIERAQVQRLQALRASRSDASVRQALSAVDAAARGGDNLVPPIIAAVERLATLGEIADTLRGVFGEHQDAHGV